MPFLAILALSLLAPDPYQLSLGNPAYKNMRMTVQAGALYDLRTGRTASIADICRAAKGASFVFLGESHDNAKHHVFQADVVRALAADGRSVSVGMEMFPFGTQPVLNLWTLGKLSEPDFITRSDWKTVWGFDYTLYKPIFDAARELGTPVVGLNVPRDWVRRVGRNGPAALTAEEQGEMPPLDLTNAEHKEMIKAMIGDAPGHTVGDGMFTGQVLWDTAMAHNALRWWNRYERPSNNIMVIVAGSGHVMYDLGINYRLSQRTPARRINVVMMETKDPTTISRSLADFVYVTGEQRVTTAP